MEYSFFVLLMAVFSLVIFIPVYFFIRNVKLIKLGFVAIEITLLGGILSFKSTDSLVAMVISHLLLCMGMLLIFYLAIKKE
ncbi:hypothetical protein M3661_03690 [Paenibacillus sp. MER 180]|uniref:hypothetical protein n=1 Tax=unclassified Paenibacillus TaxID=185978 RepID=UPI0008065482|nr:MULTISPECIES: hypothetical protein [unclassified Paenibacillus]MCM3289227.1 hypothetical protein [Paenibacillus sp. MER 180]OBY76596.1 hypothetical protein BBG47_26245 [Paenibacillus sp. KS1]